MAAALEEGERQRDQDQEGDRHTPLDCNRRSLVLTRSRLLGGVGMCDAESRVMSTINSEFELHDHAGARWLAPFLAMVVLAMLGLALLLVYPHLGLAGQI